MYWQSPVTGISLSVMDESRVAPEYQPLARMVNGTLEKAAQMKELKHRADTMINYNPMAIAILRKDKTRIHINKAYEKSLAGNPRGADEKEAHRL